MSTIENYRGLIPAIACPFTPSYEIDEAALRQHASWLAEHPGVVAVMTNGHTGEVFSLTAQERAEVTRIVADELRDKLPIISSIVCEGVREAKEHAALARDAGAKALDVMPPHLWLRFGFRPGHVFEYFEAIAETGLDLVPHVYPAWTRASYSSATLGSGEPTGEAHARMKMGMYLAGVLDSPTVRPPTEPPSENETNALRAAVANAELLRR